MFCTVSMGDPWHSYVGITLVLSDMYFYILQKFLNPSTGRSTDRQSRILGIIQYGLSKKVLLLASERSERDTIRGVQIRAGEVYVYIYIY